MRLDVNNQTFQRIVARNCQFFWKDQIGQKGKTAAERNKLTSQFLLLSTFVLQNRVGYWLNLQGKRNHHCTEQPWDARLWNLPQLCSYVSFLTCVQHSHEIKSTKISPWMVVRLMSFHTQLVSCGQLRTAAEQGQECGPSEATSAPADVYTRAHTLSVLK